MSDFRYSADVGFERRCPACLDWWPITVEFWKPRWIARCRACVNAARREYQRRRYATDPEFRETKRAAARLTAWKDRQNRRMTLLERKAAYYAANRERILERSRIYYHANRDRILARNRQRKAA